jgi:hypothetical protein
MWASSRRPRPKQRQAGGGGGGGDHSIVDPSKGKLPKFEKNPIQRLRRCRRWIILKLPMEAAINVQKEHHPAGQSEYAEYRREELV